MLIEIQDLPKMPNQLLRKHWAIVSKESNKWHSLMRRQIVWNKSPLAKAKLTLVRYSVKEPDYDNLVLSFKYVVDALVECGVIIDDRFSVIGESKYKWEKANSKASQRIQVLIEPVIP